MQKRGVRARSLLAQVLFAVEWQIPVATLDVRGVCARTAAAAFLRLRCGWDGRAPPHPIKVPAPF